MSRRRALWWRRVWAFWLTPAELAFLAGLFVAGIAGGAQLARISDLICRGGCF